MKTRYISICIVAILMFSLFPNVTSVSITKTNQTSDKESTVSEGLTLKFSDDRMDASTLGISGILSRNDFFKINYDSMESQQYSLQTSDCKIYERDNGNYMIDIEGLELSGSPGQPMMPIKNIVFRLPKHVKVKDVVMTDTTYREINNKLRIAPMPKPLLIQEDESAYEEYTKNVIEPRMKLYLSDNFYPGEILSFDVGKSNKETVVIVHIYPLQYIPRYSELLLITQGEINVLYEVDEDETVRSNSLSDAENIIITPPKFEEQATDLKNFHDGQGILTEVIETTWIEGNYEVCENPPFEGYKNPLLNDWIKIKNYDYRLAKKIISFLRDTSAHSSLQYVTLLGDGIDIPPSYYYYESNNSDVVGWVPTDFLYSSPDFDLIPNYYVGRLPVSSETEATHVVNKIINWNSTNLFDNITLAGGQTFGTMFFAGELNIVNIINKGYTKGANISKLFETDGLFRANKILNVLKGGSGLFYHFGHGSGTLFDTGDSTYIAPSDVYSLPGSNRTPVIFSLSCSNAYYDSDIMKPPFPGFSTSFGESVLLSDAGGIAYIGGSRNTLAGWIIAMDEGYTEFAKELYFQEMGTLFMKAYSEGRSTLGNITAQVLLDYNINNDISDKFNLYTLFEFVLLGDPALKISQGSSSTMSYEIPKSKIENPLKIIKLSENATLPVIPRNETFTIKSMTNSTNLKVKLIKNSKVIKKENKTTIDNNLTYELFLNKSDAYCLRVVTEDHKEGWLYFQVARVVDDDFNSSTPGINETKWSKIQDAIDAIEPGSKAQELIFVFNGTYKENIHIQKNVALVGEDKLTTIIDGQNKGDVVTIGSCICQISEFTIINSGTDKSNAGFAIKSGAISAKIDSNIIDGNENGIYVYEDAIGMVSIRSNTISNSTHGIIQNTKRKIFSNSLVWISDNIIQNNKYGILLKKSGFMILLPLPNLIFSNLISNNKIGLFLNDCKRVWVDGNDFIDNAIHATFYKSNKNLFITNYWDNWIGVKLKRIPNGLLPPKFIYGTRGKILGLLPIPHMDILPSKIPLNS